MEKRWRSYKPHSETNIVLRGHPAVSVWCSSEHNGQCSWFIPYCASTWLLMERDCWLGISSKIARHLFLWQFLALTIVSTLATPLNVLEKYYGILQTLDYMKRGCPISNSTSKCLTTSKASDLGRVVGGQTPGPRYRIMKG